MLFCYFVMFHPQNWDADHPTCLVGVVVKLCFRDGMDDMKNPPVNEQFANLNMAHLS